MLTLQRPIAGTIAVVSAIAVIVLGVRSPVALGPEMDTSLGMVIQALFSVVYAVILFYVYPRVRYHASVATTANFSYSLYVMHWPLLLLVLSLSQNWIGNSLFKTWAVALVAVPAILILVIPLAAVLERHDEIKKAVLSRFPKHIGRRLTAVLSTVGIAGLIFAGGIKLYRHAQNCRPVFDETMCIFSR